MRNEGLRMNSCILFQLSYAIAATIAPPRIPKVVQIRNIRKFVSHPQSTRALVPFKRDCITRVSYVATGKYSKPDPVSELDSSER